VAAADLCHELDPGVILKLSFIHARIRACSGHEVAHDDATRAVIAGLKRGAAQPVTEH
jgi:predicted ATPase